LRKQPVPCGCRARRRAAGTEWRVGAVRVTVESDDALGPASQPGVWTRTCASNNSDAWATRRTSWRESNWKSKARPFAPSSLLNRMRREAVERLQEAQAPQCSPIPSARRDRAEPVCPPAGRLPPEPPHNLHLLVRTPAQLEAAIAVPPASITLDYLDLYGLKPSLERVRAPAFRRASPARAC
jgi:U32 family peptidase